MRSTSTRRSNATSSAWSWRREIRARWGCSLDGLIRYGASPRATIGITLAAKAWAFLRGRGYVTPQDVKAIAPDVLRHRVAVTYEAEAERVTAEGIVDLDPGPRPHPLVGAPPSNRRRHPAEGHNR